MYALCADGRPIAVKVTKYQLEKMFQRIVYERPPSERPQGPRKGLRRGKVNPPRL